ncbi:TetR/AcrR family transcriptional regulator [Paraconexibacter sp.]|uniref:TetR/AcrR family transcriptional regulator n=1 Tax=Paraconexibacter sp. TaxID=2949640 RepID=UPI003569E503
MSITDAATTGESAPDTPPRFRRLAGDDRRRQIIGIARELFAARPYGEVPTTEIARAAGVSHGLLTYHFGSKRKLYLEVLRSMLYLPRAPSPMATMDPDVDGALEVMTDWWLDHVQENRELWLSLLGARGLGRDPEVEALLDSYEEASRADLIRYLAARDPADAPAELWAVVVAWQGLAEATAVEWLERERINRAQAKTLILLALRQLLKLQGAVRRAGEPGD